MANVRRNLKETAPSEFAPGSQDYDAPEFKMEMPYQAQVLARLLQNDYLGRIANHGVAPAQSFVLAELWYNEPLSQVELARRLDIGKATIGQTLNRLERNGMIVRTRQTADRRVIMTHLTEKGRAMRGPLEQAALEQRVMIRDLLGAETVDALSALMAVAVTRLSRLGLSATDHLGPIK
jgi:DNA-binding MarR family transcriptional regulator